MARKTKTRQDSMEGMSPSLTCTATEQVGDLVYVSGADTVARADASDSAKTDVVGFIVSKPTTTSCRISAQPGPVTGASGLTSGMPVYLSAVSPGAVTTSAPSSGDPQVGVAISTTSWLFYKDYMGSDAPVSTGRLSMAGPIKSITVETATDTINLAGLDFDADGEYDIVLSIVDDDTGGSAYSIYAGDPTVDATATNYDTTRVNDGTAVSGASDAIFGTTGATGQVVSGRLRVNQDPNGRFIVIGETAQRTTPQSNQLAVRSVNTFDNISVIQISASNSSGIGAGSYIRIYRKGGTLSTGTSISPLDVKRAADGFDDEFDSTTLDSKWTAVTGAAGSVALTGYTSPGSGNGIYDLTTRSGWLLMQAGGSESVKFRQDHTLANGSSVVVSISAGAQVTMPSNEVNIGLAINDSDTSPAVGNSLLLYVVEPDGSQDTNIEVQGVGNYAAVIQEDLRAQAHGKRIFLRVSRFDNKYHFYHSSDGTSWSLVTSATINGIADNVWLFYQGYSASAVEPTIAAVDWIRLGSAELDPWPLVDGSSVQSVVTGEYRGARGIRTTTISVPGASSVNLVCESTAEDTDGFFDLGGSNPERITIPAGVNRVRLRASAEFSDVSGDVQLFIYKNTSTMLAAGDNNTTNADYIAVSTPNVQVVEGDYFTAVYYAADAGNLVAPAGNVWFEIEVLEPQVVLTDRGTVNVSSSDSPYTLPPTKKTIYVTADGATTINLPALAGNGDMEAEVKIISGSSAVTLDPDGSETIEGASTYAFSGVGESRTFRAKSINGNLGWYMVARASLDPATLIEFTCTATEQVNDLVYISAADTVAQADASVAGTADVLGWIFAKPTTTSALVSVGPGPVTSSGLTTGAKVYLSDTAGQASPSAGTVTVEVGLAKSTTSFVFLRAK